MEAHLRCQADSGGDGTSGGGIELETGQEVAGKVCGGVESSMGMSTKVAPTRISVTTPMLD